MITSAKPGTKNTLETMNVVDPPEIHFLTEDGNLTQDKFTLSEQNHFVSTEDWKRYGKVETFDGKNRFYLKTFRGGRPGETLPDPWGLLSKREDLSTFATQRGTRSCEYVQVSEQWFQTYTTYLQTRNPVFFKHVERAILNGERMI
jgi:hypothetical protein